MSFKSGLIHRCNLFRAGMHGEHNVMESSDQLIAADIPCRVYSKNVSNSTEKGRNLVTATLSIQFIIGQDVQHNDTVEITGRAARLYPGKYRCNEPYAPNDHHWEATLSKEEDAPCPI